ncbi:MAG: hypothetical protein ACFFCW_45180 [Candidatus Hodarchaeota archaeon]
MKRFFAFTYFACMHAFALFGNRAENEYCTLLVGEYEGKVNPNPKEVSNFSHASLLELKEKTTKDNKRNGDIHTMVQDSPRKIPKHPYSKQFRCGRRDLNPGCRFGRLPLKDCVLTRPQPLRTV